MIKTDKIFVAVDFKKSTDKIFSYAIWMSKIVDCKNLCIFHIMEYNLTPPAYLMPYINKEKNKVVNKLRELSDKLKSFHVEIEIKVVFGRLIESIREVIKGENNIAVIGFKTYITRPSTSERILKGIKVPVLIVKGEDFSEINPENIKIDNILCPVDFSENSLRALKLAKDIAESCHANLLAVHVVPEQKVRCIIEEPEQIEKYLGYLKEEAEEKILKLNKNLNYEVLSGIPAEEILKKIEQPDLIVMGSKGRSYAESIIIGSVAEAVIKNSTKPVLLVP
jgi:nucleotide-binding universal stress UspA family protein